MRQSRDEDESVAGALSAVIVAGQQFLVDRVDLGLIEFRQYAERLTASVSLMLLGGLVIAGALYAVDVALVDLLAQSVAPSSAILCVAGPNAALGLGLLIAGLRLRP